MNCWYFTVLCWKDSCFFSFEGVMEGHWLIGNVCQHSETDVWGIHLPPLLIFVLYFLIRKKFAPSYKCKTKHPDNRLYCIVLCSSDCTALYWHAVSLMYADISLWWNHSSITSHFFHVLCIKAYPKCCFIWFDFLFSLLSQLPWILKKN